MVVKCAIRDRQTDRQTDRQINGQQPIETCVPHKSSRKSTEQPCNHSRCKMFVQVNRDSELATKFNTERSSYKSMYLGSRPPSDGRWETWMNSSGSSPYPIRYSVRPLIELFDTIYINNSEESTLSLKRARSDNVHVLCFLRFYVRQLC